MLRTAVYDCMMRWFGDVMLSIYIYVCRHFYTNLLLSTNGCVCRHCHFWWRCTIIYKCKPKKSLVIKLWSEMIVCGHLDTFLSFMTTITVIWWIRVSSEQFQKPWHWLPGLLTHPHDISGIIIIHFKLKTKQVAYGDIIYVYIYMYTNLAKEPKHHAVG